MGSEIRITAEDLFHSAADLAVRERKVYLDRACAGNADLRREVEELLRFDESSGAFLEKPALQDAARELAGDLAKSQSQSDTLNEEDWTLGPYRIRYQIGKGGMGIVYLALDTRDGREVALKVLPNDSGEDEDRLARFTREGRMLSDLKSLKHPNIAEIYEQAEYDGKPCIALEYVPGDTLADRLRQGPLPVSEALQYALQIADALKSAHDRHIVHRDLKPANIKITPEGAIKVLDFGLAKRFYGEMQSDEEHNTRSLSLTESGMLLGTPAYMSPEQWNGQAVDQRADLWAFGCLLYEMLAGDPPFEGKNRAETMRAVFAASPDWSILPKGTPLAIQDLLRRCLERVPKQRLRDAGAVRQMLSQATGKNSYTPALFLKSQVWRIRQHTRAIALAAAVALCVSVAIWYWLKVSAIPSQKNVVILPFSGFENEPAGRGFAEELSRSLQRASDELQVMPERGSAQEYLSAASMEMIIGRSGATLIVGGDVQRAGDRMRINYWLRNTHSYRLASGTVEGSATRLASLQNQVAERIKQALDPATSPLTASSSDNLSLNNASAADEYLTALGELQDDLTKDTVERPIARLEKLIRTEGDSARLQAALAHAYLLKADIVNEPELVRKAMAACEQALRLGPSTPEALVTRGLALTYLGNYSEAINSFRATLSQQPNDMEAMLGLAAAYEYAKLPEAAEKTYHEVINVWPSYWGGHNELGAFYFSQGRYEDSLTEWNSVIRLNPNGSFGFINVGNAYFKLGQYEKAKESYRRSIGKGGEAREDLYLGLGAAQLYLGEYKDAVDSFKAGIAQFPKSPMLLTSLGDAQRRIIGEETEAVRSYDRAIDIAKVDKPHEIGIARQAERFAKRSKVKASIGDEQNAISDKQNALLLIQRALVQGEEDVEVLASAVVVYNLAGDQEKTLRYVEQSLKQGHSLTELEQSPELEMLRKDLRYQQIVSQFRQQKTQ